MQRQIEGVTLKCPLCGRVCADEQLLLVHMEEYHKEPEIAVKQDQLHPEQVVIKVKASKCPHCYKRINAHQLDDHIKSEHFM